MLLDSKHQEASFSPYSTDLPCLRVAKVPRCRDLVTFLLTTTTTELITLPLALAHWVIMGSHPTKIQWQVSTAADLHITRHDCCVFLNTEAHEAAAFYYMLISCAACAIMKSSQNISPVLVEKEKIFFPPDQKFKTVV